MIIVIFLATPSPNFLAFIAPFNAIFAFSKALLTNFSLALTSFKSAFAVPDKQVGEIKYHTKWLRYIKENVIILFGIKRLSNELKLSIES